MEVKADTDRLTAREDSGEHASSRSWRQRPARVLATRSGHRSRICDAAMPTQRLAGVRVATATRHVLVAVGAALFVIGPTQAEMAIGDLSRVLQGIVQGIGFLGAGAILVRASKRQIEGLTTAATIWATAGIGVIAGLGLEATAVLSTLIILLILAVVPLILPPKSEPEGRQDD